MEAKVKEIVSNFIEIPTAELVGETKIDRSAVRNSITLHRMYAALEREGMKIEDPSRITTVQDLLARLGLEVGAPASPTPQLEPSTVKKEVKVSNGHQNGHVPTAPTESHLSIGIDIQEVSALPEATDFRESPFYQLNFSTPEIAHALLSPNPKESFAGMFAAKEALIKAQNTLRHTPFNELTLSYNAEGKPSYPGFELSISHSGSMAVAVAVQAPKVEIPEITLPQLPTVHDEQTIKSWIENAIKPVVKRQELLRPGKSLRRIALLAFLMSGLAVALGIANLIFA